MRRLLGADSLRSDNRCSAVTAPHCGASGPSVLTFSDHAGSLPAEVGLPEAVEVAVEDGGDVPPLVVRAQVLHQLVGLHHVGADLAAPADLGLAAAGDLVQLGLPLLLGPGG